MRTAGTRGLGVTLLLLALSLPRAVAAAEEQEEPIDRQALAMERSVRVNLYPVRSRISRYLEAANEKVQERDTDGALVLLRKLSPKRLNPQERALVYRLMAYVAYEAADYEGAIESFEKVLAEEILPLREDDRIRFYIAQLYASQQKWREVVTHVHRWLRYIETPDPIGYYLLAAAHFQLDEFDEGLGWARKAVEATDEPREGWLQLLAAFHVQKEDYKSVAPVLEQLLVRFPKKQYWVQLSLIYAALESYQHSLAAQQVAYLQGFLTEDKEMRRMVRSFLYHELPYPAAKALEEGLEQGTVERDAEAYELLANSWIAAREYERSLPVLQTAAALSADGNLFVRLGQVHLQREEWEEAAQELEKALAKGGLKDPGNAHLLLGIAHYNEQRVAQARTSFFRARQHESTREAADGWITHIERETASAG